VTGDDDRIIPAAGSEVLRRRIPGSVLRVVAGAGHLFFLERPQDVAGLLEAFLTGDAPPPAAPRTT
jgi:pimeloyl-ACP methyl ester carboxylesterase